MKIWQVRSLDPEARPVLAWIYFPSGSWETPSAPLELPDGGVHEKQKQPMKASIFQATFEVLPFAGVRANLLTLQPALRTLTSDYNSLKRQVKEFPLLLQEALQSARAEVSSSSSSSLFHTQGEQLMFLGSRRGLGKAEGHRSP